MEVVVVSAYKDYEVYSSVEKAYEALRNAEADDVAWCDNVSVVVKELDTQKTKSVDQLTPRRVSYEDDTYVWTRWDSESRSYKEVEL